ncbi:LPS export ABC transporter periplasmic protein LptC [Ectothiorhodospira shaposhnikovii]|uniref:LPS export ABC transporter periplasmic protein LptC n=1 Tax=Ectothiorhodospira shaposhnikovii TaxID=1054 RepID=UPI001904DB2E|nr:LPS export ABC transporter periplasmic protein LptC [Ectothiorhodospira shaposhnikovii]MBK1672514.1 LPS export ABC transporter periplasmic protein LptC [Ectothiorhodospira shaposhnikovii]
MKFPTLLMILLLSLVAAIGFWLARDADERRRAPENADADGTDFFLEQYRAIHMDRHGEPRYHLSGLRMEQRQADGSRWLEAPVLTTHQGDDSEWTLRSEQGWVSPSGAEIRLLGDVLIHRPGDETRSPVTITTRDTTLWPDPRQAETDAFTHLKTSHQEAEGIGMFLDMNREILELKRDARGTYVPH